jgi:hypothetical protein
VTPLLLAHPKLSVLYCVALLERKRYLQQWLLQQEGLE